MQQMTVLQNLLEQAEWKTQAETAAKQRNTAARLLQYAFECVPFYQRHYQDHARACAGGDIEALPVVTREMVFDAASAMVSTQLPRDHGATYPMQTSGSTGQNIEILGTDFTRLFYDALMLREHRWHQRDFKRCLMAIRWARRDFAPAPAGLFQETWGMPIDNYKETGPAVFINISSANQDQIDAMFHYKPAYLQTYPSQLAALASFCLDNDIQLPFLLEARVTGETYTEKHKQIISQAWPQIRVNDVYSCVEAGIVAQQCPEHGSYHVNMENCLVEIVDDENHPCAAGENGRILLTTLMNYATPLIRYEIGDYGSWGQPCPCGRGSLVIKQILGRSRNRLTLPGGESRFPYLGERDDVPAVIRNKIRKFQIIQQTVHDIEVKFVVGEALTREEETTLLNMFHGNFVYPFNIYISYHDDIPLGPNGKYEEFVSRVSSPINA